MGYMLYLIAHILLCVHQGCRQLEMGKRCNCFSSLALFHLAGQEAIVLRKQLLAKELAICKLLLHPLYSQSGSKSTFIVIN